MSALYSEGVRMNTSALVGQLQFRVFWLCILKILLQQLIYHVFSAFCEGAQMLIKISQQALYKYDKFYTAI